MKLGIGIITAGGFGNSVPTVFFRSVSALWREIYRGRMDVTGCAQMWSGKFPIDVARNDVCQQALDHDVDALLFLDADHEFGPDSVRRLISAMRDGASVVTGRYHVKKPPYHPNLYLVPRESHVEGDYRTVHYGQGRFPVDMCGAGALLIHRSVLEDIGFPWFRYERDPHPPHDRSVSEDVYFCRRAREEGHIIWADWDAEFAHVILGSVTGQWYAEYLATMEAKIASGDTDLAGKLVVCGYEDGYQLPSGEVIPPYGRQPLATA